MQASVIGQIKALQDMSVAQLQTCWVEVFGEPARSRNKPYLYRRIAWEIQAKAYGGLSARAQDRIRELAPDHFPRAVVPRDAIENLLAQPKHRRDEPRRNRDLRLPPVGSVIVKDYKGRRLRLVVHEDHFELDGQSFGSLSEAARHASGARWDGFLFWNLKQRKPRS